MSDETEILKQDYYLLAPKRTLKDSVFKNLFSIPENLKRLYLCLNPDDTDVREDDIRIVSSDTIFCGGIVNDLAFIVRDTELYMVEAQSTRNINMTYRMNDYFLEISRKEIPNFNYQQYARTPFKGALNPHFFVVHAGRETAPAFYETRMILPFCEDYMVKIKVLTKERTHGIIKEYCLFCLMFYEFTDRFGREKRAVLETIRYCVENNILREFLLEHHQEVERIMMEYNTQEAVTLGYGIEMKRQGKDEQRKEDNANFDKALANAGISDEIKEQIMADLRRMSAN